MEASGWKGRQGTALASNETDAAFMRGAIAALAEHGCATVHSIHLDGRPVSMQIVARAGAAAFTWKTAYDEAFHDFSPGMLLLEDYTAAFLADKSIAFVDSCSFDDTRLHVGLAGAAVGRRHLDRRAARRLAGIPRAERIAEILSRRARGGEGRLSEVAEVAESVTAMPMQDTDVVIAGGGLAGSLAAAMLGRAGIRTVVIDPHPVYPPDFRCEKLDGPQMRTLGLTGMADAVLQASTADRECWVARFGRVVEKRPGDQQGIMYDTLVNTIRAEVSGKAEFIQAKVTDITAGPERQTVRTVGRRGNLGAACGRGNRPQRRRPGEARHRRARSSAPAIRSRSASTRCRAIRAAFRFRR